MPDPYLSKPLDDSPLLEFLVAYFHEDWRLEDPTESAVVARYKAEARTSDVASLIRDIDDILSRWDDFELRTLIERHLVSVHPHHRAETWLRWLRSGLESKSSEARPLK